MTDTGPYGGITRVGWREQYNYNSCTGNAWWNAPVPPFYHWRIPELPQVRVPECFIKAGSTTTAPAVLIHCQRNKREWEAWVTAPTQYAIKRLNVEGYICQECAAYAASVLETESQVDTVHLRKLHINPQTGGFDELVKQSSQLQPLYFYNSGPWLPQRSPYV